MQMGGCRHAIRGAKEFGSAVLGVRVAALLALTEKLSQRRDRAKRASQLLRAETN
jgi:hypothetical protein